MPVNELESHPYLFNQVNDFANQNQLARYCKLIVGTFPIYAITDSDPIEEMGHEKRVNWNVNGAFMQYFYGSLDSQFWILFANSLNEDIPLIRNEAIELLNRNNFFITDTISSAFRIEYSPNDNDLIIDNLNHNLNVLLQSCVNLKIIYFTSIKAKRDFCNILNVNFVNIKDNIETINNINYRMIILMTPAGNARSAWHFRHTFPLLQGEMDNRINGNGYALAYRQRYYSHYLQLPCKPIDELL